MAAFRLARKVTLASLAIAGVALLAPDVPAAAASPVATDLVKSFCLDCHAGAGAEGQIDLERLLENPLAAGFKTWQKVAVVLEKKSMPPAVADQPDDELRRAAARQIRRELEQTVRQHAGDPGPSLLRRLTSAEYGYTVRDLTGLELDLQQDLVSDAVGGEGFTNVGNVQFLQEAALERYLEAANRIAAHAVIGAGPLEFYSDPGQTGLELSAIHRIQQVYRRHGFRTAAGEGGEPFGLDLYPQAFFIAWQYQHRQALGRPGVTLAQLAAEQAASERFVNYVWSMLNQQAPTFPASEIIARWRAISAPSDASLTALEQARRKCDQLYGDLQQWQTLLAGAVTKKEEAIVLSEASLRVAKEHSFEAEIDWPRGDTTAQIVLFVAPADPRRKQGSSVIWHNARLRFRTPGQRLPAPQPLREFLDDAQRANLNFGFHPDGRSLPQTDFVLPGGSVTLQIPIPTGATRAELFVDVELDLPDDGVVRCIVSDDQSASQGKSVSAILADPDSAAAKAWLTGVRQFARLFPQISHREPAPSDRDPIPAPFDNSYNVPERDHFHYKVKYYRDDRFLVEYILDGATRKQLDQAWADLLGSFEYHDIYLRFVATKYGLDLAGHSIANLPAAWIDSLPHEPRQNVQRLKTEYDWVRQSLASAESGHVRDVQHLAERAWRRPLTEQDQARLQSYYQGQRQNGSSHEQAIRKLLARVLVAPDFLYRIERPTQEGIAEASDWELATRLSCFLWSTLPDDELRQLSARGRLRDPAELVRQAQRMVHDPKVRRLATEFFGQWLGFYQFDRYRGIDPDRFPEFNDALKSSMYEESIALFEYIVRDDRPVNEILFADYTFLNGRLADHYGIDAPAGAAELARVQNVADAHRGGLLGLGAVLAATSAPLRTSPVKRGDWILRRVLGTPVPPPPADAGSLPADEVVADGRTIRQRLAAHRRNTSCNNCHTRIDPLGFALENYDPLGRWRERYRDAEPVDARGQLADGRELAGAAGLRDYLKSQQHLFHRTLCSRLVGYCLGRSESIYDQQLIDDLVAVCRGGEAPLSDLIAKIVVSPQFRLIRGVTPPSQSTSSTK